MTPEGLNFMDVPQPVLSPDSIYVEITGREVFEEISISGLNRSPIEILTAFITADSTIEQTGATVWPEIPTEKICENVLVDGSIAMRYTGDEKADEPYVFLRDCVEIHRSLIVQKLRDDRGRVTNVTRVYEKTESEWIVKDVTGYGTGHELVQSTESYPLEMILSYPYGEGLLYYNQKTYRRLEEIEESLRQQTGPASLSLIVTGYAGDWPKAQDTFAKGAKIIGIPGNADVHRVSANNTADQLMRSSLDLMQKYLKNMHLVEVSETSTMSGKSRKLAMMPMLNYVNTIRMVLDEIY